MKALVLIWSYATFYPGITPVFLFPTYFLVVRLFRRPLERINAALLFLFATVIIFGVTYVNFAEGPALYIGYLENNGVETDAVVNAIDGETIELTFKGENDEEEKVLYTAQARRFFPLAEEPIAMPDKLDRARIAYYPGVESGFIILKDPKKSTYGAKISCDEATQVLKRAETAFRFEQFPSPERHTAYLASIESFLSLSCGDMTERERIREILANLK